jgi:hypothetical protein
MAGKITVKLSYGDDLRRLTVDPTTFTFPQLKETIKRLYASLSSVDVDGLVVKYLDDEEDLVTISSNEELVEAFNLSRDKNPPVLRLHLKEAPKSPESEKKDGDAKECPHGHRRFHGQRPWWARRNGGPRRCPFQGEPQQPVNLGELPKTRKDERHAHELVLTPEPYGHGNFVCDGCQLAGQGASYQCAGCNFDLHIDCAKAREATNPWQRRQQWFRLHQEAMKAMEQKTREGLEKARELLKEQATVSPFHRVTPLYNLACVESLLGEKLEKALEYLQEAVAAGWTDVEHIKKDADLLALQGLDAFKALIASLEADSSDDDSGVEVHVNFGGLPKEERKKLKQEWRQKRMQERAEKLQSRVEKVQARAEQAKAENDPIAQKLEVRAEMLQAKAEKMQAKVEKIQSKLESPKEEVKAESPKPEEKKPEEKKPESPKPEEKKPEPVNVPSPVAQPQLSGSSTIDEFQAKLKTLEEMGFADRRRNITALVLARGDLVNAVQSLLSGQ